MAACIENTSAVGPLFKIFLNCVSLSANPDTLLVKPLRGVCQRQQQKQTSWCISRKMIFNNLPDTDYIWILWKYRIKGFFSLPHFANKAGVWRQHLDLLIIYVLYSVSLPTFDSFSSPLSLQLTCFCINLSLCLSFYLSLSRFHFFSYSLTVWDEFFTDILADMKIKWNEYLNRR